MSYTVESHWHYAADERYNAGRGLAAFKDTLEEAESLFSTLASDPGYAVDIKENATDRVVKHAGPDTRVAIASMHRAWHRRQTESEAA